jgi:hypothetical protein
VVDLLDPPSMARGQVGLSKTNAIVVFVPFKLLKNYRRIQQRLIRELEKKFR